MQPSECRSSLVAALAMIMAATVLGGCQSLATVMTQVDIEMEVEAVGQAAPPGGRIGVRESPPMFPFDNPWYSDEHIDWWAQIPPSLSRITTDFTNLSDIPIELRWDRAMWRSSQHLEFIPLSVGGFGVWLHNEREWSIDDRDRLTPAAPPSVLLVPRNVTRIILGSPPGQLFATGKYFDIQRVDKGHGFIDDGIGRWLELELPVEAGDRSWTYRIRLTARDIAQWNSYH